LFLIKVFGVLQVMGAVYRCLWSGILCFALVMAAGNLMPRPVAAQSIEDICSVENSLLCKANRKPPDSRMIEVCDACGHMWSSMAGLSHCCTCDEIIFSVCLQAVFGKGR
jgi:hypothetical protein